MLVLKYAAIILLSLAALLILIFSIVSRKPLRILLFNCMLGVAAFIAVELTKKYTGVDIRLNEYTATATAVLGIPGVCGVLILNLIFGV